MNDLKGLLAMVKVDIDHAEELAKIKRRCFFHELKCTAIFNPSDKDKYLVINITDSRFLHINSILSRANFDEHIGYIDNFIDAWIINQKEGA